MSLGTYELLFVVITAIGTGIAWRLGGRRWLVLLPLVALCAALVSPADIVSTALIAVPNALLMAWAVYLQDRSSGRRRQVSA